MWPLCITVATTYGLLVVKDTVYYTWYLYCLEALLANYNLLWYYLTKIITVIC